MRGHSILRRIVCTLLALLVVGSGFAQDRYRVGVLRGPTAVAFAPMISEPVALGGRPVEIVAYPEPSNLIAAFLAGDVDAATIPSNAAAQLSGRGAPVQVASTFIWGVLYLVGPAGVQLHELSGPVHSIGRGATPDIVLRYVIEQEGLDDTIVVEYGYAQVELSQLLVAGRVRAGILPEPFVTRVLRENGSLGIVADIQERFEAHSGSGLPQTVLVVRPNDPASAALVELLRSSVSEVLADPARSSRIIARLGLGLDEATARSSLPRLNLRVESASGSRAALRRYLQILYDFEPAAVGGRMPPDEFYGE